jgi:hypothetical protein
VIIEEEDDTYPLFRIENLTEDVAVWYMQKDAATFDEEACMLSPMSFVPFAYSETSLSQP